MDIDTMEKNLLDGWGMVTPVQLHRGVNWYPEAHDFAHVIGNGNVALGAGLLAAMSPQKQWDVNRRLAVDAALGIFAGQVGDALRKARAIYEGADPASVLPMSKKTGHFYMNILDPADPDHVTIDRHAIRAATCDWDNGSPRITEREYGNFVLAYLGAGRKVGLSGSAFQAVIWGWARGR